MQENSLHFTDSEEKNTDQKYYTIQHVSIAIEEITEQINSTYEHSCDNAR